MSEAQKEVTMATPCARSKASYCVSEALQIGVDLAGIDTESAGVYLQVCGRGLRDSYPKTVIYVTTADGSPHTSKSDMARLITQEYARHGVEVVTLTHREELVGQSPGVMLMDEHDDDIARGRPNRGGITWDSLAAMFEEYGAPNRWYAPGRGKTHLAGFIEGFDFKRPDTGADFTDYRRNINHKRKLKEAPRGPRKGMR